jgi:hypothetical protein
MSNVYPSCPHGGDKSNKEKIANATGFCHKNKWQKNP